MPDLSLGAELPRGSDPLPPLPPPVPEPGSVREASCPNRTNHTPSPPAYLAWHEWAEHKAKTHQQIRCGGCNLLVIWVPKTEVEKAGEST